MAIQMKKPAATTAPATKAPAQSASAETKKTGGVSFLKRGKEAKETMEKVKMQSEMNGKNIARRFFIKVDKDATITFCDGDLNNGSFDNPFAFEHFVMVMGKPRNYLCLHEEESCPVCEGGSKYAYVCYFTIIDHSEYKGQDGKTYKHQKRLFVAKPTTVNSLLKYAQKRGGLAGCTFDVSRSNDKSAAVGDVFDFTEKLSPEQMKKQFGEEAIPFDYDKVINEMFVSAVDLRKLGFGSTSIGNEPPPTDEDHSDAL